MTTKARSALFLLCALFLLACLPAAAAASGADAGTEIILTTPSGIRHRRGHHRCRHRCGHYPKSVEAGIKH